MVEYDFYLKREYSLFYGVAALYGLVKWVEGELGKTAAVRGEGSGSWFSTFAEKGRLQELRESFLRKVKTDLSVVEKEIEKTHEVGKEFLEFVKSLRVSSNMQDGELHESYQRYFDLLTRYCDNLFRSFYLAEFTSQEFERFLVEKLPKEKLLPAVEHYARPAGKAAIFLIAEYFQKEQDIPKRVAYIKQNFPWIGNTDTFQQQWNDAQILDYVKSFALPTQKEHLADQEIEKLKDAPIVKIQPALLYLKDKRDDYRREAFYLALPLIKEVARRHGLNVQELGYLLPDELSGDLKKKVEERRQGYIVEIIDGKRTITAGPGAEKKFLKQDETAGVTSVSGIIGCSGRVQGRAQVIKTKEDIIRFGKGNVLVAVTTNPEYVPAMQKAIAFVTDEGGLTSHAAIIARELKKPCIVGTKIATRVFKDGDKVEVDAEKGVVRKVE